MRFLLFFVVYLCINSTLLAQMGTIKGTVFNEINNEPIPFATIVVDSLFLGTTSDVDGAFRIDDIPPGVYSVSCSYIGFKKTFFAEIQVTSTKPTLLEIGLQEESTTLTQVEVKASPYKKPVESPVSLRTINAAEIYRSPGGNRDISKVIQNLPGVGSGTAFRNDIIVRGGSPNENRFFLDGIEVPNINHFATQGASGGPVGMINVNFIKEVDFYAGAFPANRGNSLSSIMDFKQIKGNDEKLRGTFAIGSSDVGLTLDGPLGKNSSFILSVRRSYLQLLFKALALPFLPTYNDMQFKQDIKINKKNKITIIGLGAIDDFALNTTVNDNLDDTATIRRNNYILGNLPVNTQWNYTVGAKWTRFGENAYQTLVASRNHLNNSAVKYTDNEESPENLTLDYNSQEIENKLRFEHTYRKNGWRLNAGVGFENVKYTNSTFSKSIIGGQVQNIAFDSELTFNKYALFMQVGKKVFAEKLALAFGLRTDFNDYSADMSNPLKQLSPRLSASYALTPKWSINANVGMYTQLPPYTILGYRGADNQLINKNNNVEYIKANHYVAGLEFSPTAYTKISAEGFLKQYTDYPFSIRDSISLANLGGDFGVVGNEPVSSTSKGRSYGIELLVQQKLASSFYGILSYTLVRSEFGADQGDLIPSAWDNRHILNVTAGKQFKGNWEVGFKYRLAGGTPYTPYNVGVTSQIPVWNTAQKGILDYTQLNSLRNPVFHGLDVRIDKKWFFKKVAINVYFDVQNVLNTKTDAPPYIDVKRDDNGQPIVDPNNPNAYLMELIPNSTGSLIPSTGVMIEF